MKGAATRNFEAGILTDDPGGSGHESIRFGVGWFQVQRLPQEAVLQRSYSEITSGGPGGISAILSFLSAF
jgi:hypothetical protein